MPRGRHRHDRRPSVAASPAGPGAARSARLAILAAGVLLAGCAGVAAPPSGSSGIGVAAARFAEVRHDPPALRAFVYRMPKGADLHTHLSGAVYAETLLRLAAEKGLCVETGADRLVPPPCTKDGKPPAAEVVKDRAAYARLVDAMSMRDFEPGNGVSGHDQFFATFGRFAPATDSVGDLAAEVVDRAGRQQVQHIELMTTWQGRAAQELGRRAGWSEDLAALQQKIEAAGLPRIVEQARRDLDAAEARRVALLGCGTPQASPGCDVSVRYLQQVSRIRPREEVFAQTLLAFQLVQADPRVVGLNFVAPEDDPVALADYDQHMRMLDHLHRRFPTVPVALHAGELTLGLVPPEHLRDHIRKAVEVGHARRIGHGVGVMYEDRPWDLLRLMAERRVAVETNLTSNDVILGVRGDDHPFRAYRRAGVPLVISTDDEGVSRIDLTHELQRAALTYGLGYADLVELARASLEHSFLPGRSLWADPRGGRLDPACAGASLTAETLPDACAALVRESEKAARQWRLEQKLRAFDDEMRAQPGS